MPWARVGRRGAHGRRQAAMQSGPYDVVVDGLVHARLPQKATTEVEFAVGRHTVQVRVDAYGPVLEIDVPAGEVVTLRTGPNLKRTGRSSLLSGGPYLFATLNTRPPTSPWNTRTAGGTDTAISGEGTGSVSVA